MTRKFRKRTFRETECKDCGGIFKTWAHNAFRCPKCRRKFLLEYLRNYNKNGKKEKEDCDDPINYSQGTSYCESYNNDDIQCVMCYEQDLKSFKTCKE